MSRRPGRGGVAVVGGGISGLAAAHRLRTLLGPTAQIIVLEQRGRLGGVLRTVDLAGRAVRRRRRGVPVAAARGTAPARRAGAGRRGYIRPARRRRSGPGGRPCRCPRDAAGRADERGPARRACSRRGLGRRGRRTRPAAALDAGGDVALGALLRDRFGDELADRLADPLLGGVYAGRVDALGLRATLPALAAALDAGAPSLTAAADRATAPPASRGLRKSDTRVGETAPESGPTGSCPPPVFGALPGGYATLVDALAAGVDVRLSTTVARCTGAPTVGGSSSDPARTPSRSTPSCSPSPPGGRPAAGRRRPGRRARAGRSSWRRRSSSRWRTGTRTRPPCPDVRVLVAAGEPAVDQGRDALVAQVAAPRAGGDRRPRAAADVAGPVRRGGGLQVDDAELVARSRADLAVLAGITAAPVAVHVQRWGGGLPQYAVGHLDRVRAIEDAVAGCRARGRGRGAARGRRAGVRRDRPGGGGAAGGGRSP